MKINNNLPVLHLGSQNVHYNYDPKEHEGIGIKLGERAIIHVDKDELYHSYAATTKEGVLGFFQRMFTWLSIHITRRLQDASFLTGLGINQIEIDKISLLLNRLARLSATRVSNAARRSGVETGQEELDLDDDDDDDDVWGYRGPNGELTLQSEYKKAQQAQLGSDNQSSIEEK